MKWPAPAAWSTEQPAVWARLHHRSMPDPREAVPADWLKPAWLTPPTTATLPEQKPDPNEYDPTPPYRSLLHPPRFRQHPSCTASSSTSRASLTLADFEG